MEPVQISKAQLEHLRNLVAERDTVMKSIQRFVDYLTAEHELDTDKKWKVMPSGHLVEVDTE